MMDNDIAMYLSSIVAAEFSIKQPITDLELDNFRTISFSIPHGIEAAKLWNSLRSSEDGDSRHVARDDIKLIAQAVHESIPFILTEDVSTLSKYCDRLRLNGSGNTRAITLVNGFDRSSFREDGQNELPLVEG